MKAFIQSRPGLINQDTSQLLRLLEGIHARWRSSTGSCQEGLAFAVKNFCPRTTRCTNPMQP